MMATAGSVLDCVTEHLKSKDQKGPTRGMEFDIALDTLRLVY